MDELYGLHSTCSDHYSMPHVVPENMVVATAGAPVDYYGAFSSPTGVSFPMLGSSEHFFSGSSAVSDATEMQRGGTTGCYGGSSEEEVSSAIRAKIASHPLYPKLLQAYIDCQKVGAPPEMAYMLDEIRQESSVLFKRPTAATSCLGADPELDEFMETYCDILVKYKSDLSRPFNEATTFLNDIEAQLNSLCNSNTTTTSRTHISGHCGQSKASERVESNSKPHGTPADTAANADEAVGSSDEDVSGGEAEVQDSARANEDRELKDKLLQKYSGYISTLKHEFSKKKKKGKLPKEARQVLLNWWNIHYKWPYPTEADKVALADATGLDQKQINNWFINQRKRHWKPSENMQFTVVDSIYGPFFMND